MPMVAPIIAVAASVAAEAGAAAAGISASVGAALGISAATAGALIGGIASIAVTFIGSAIIGSGAKPANNSADATNRAEQIRAPVAPRQIILGTAKVSGPLVYIYSPPLARTNYESAVFGYAAPLRSA
jgi:hypothetical protein